jgi:hypothetical protein
VKEAEEVTSRKKREQGQNLRLIAIIISGILVTVLDIMGQLVTLPYCFNIEFPSRTVRAASWPYLLSSSRSVQTVHQHKYVATLLETVASPLQWALYAVDLRYGKSATYDRKFLSSPLF